MRSVLGGGLEQRELLVEEAVLRLEVIRCEGLDSALGLVWSLEQGKGLLGQMVVVGVGLKQGRGRGVGIGPAGFDETLVHGVHEGLLLLSVVGGGLVHEVLVGLGKFRRGLVLLRGQGVGEVSPVFVETLIHGVH